MTMDGLIKEDMLNRGNMRTEYLICHGHSQIHIFLFSINFHLSKSKQRRVLKKKFEHLSSNLSNENHSQTLNWLGVYQCTTYIQQRVNVFQSFRHILLIYNQYKVKEHFKQKKN